MENRKSERSVLCLVTFLQKQMMALQILISISIDMGDVDVKIDTTVDTDGQACFVYLQACREWGE